MEESKRLFNAPMPGESLTRPPKSAAYEQPPQYTNVEDALEFTWEAMKSPTQSAKIIEFLKTGYELDRPAMSAQGLAKTIVTGGFGDGKWTPDMAMLMEPIVMTQIAAIAEEGGLKKFNTALPTERDSFVDYMGSLKNMRDDHVAGQSSQDTIQGSEGEDRFGPIIGDEGIRESSTFSPSSIPNKPTFGGLAATGMKQTESVLLEFTARHEGKKDLVYDDETGKAIPAGKSPKGKRTVGIGFNMDDSTAKGKWKAAGVPEDFNKVLQGKQKLSEKSIDSLFKETIKVAEQDAKLLVKDLDKKPQAVQDVVKALAFQLGRTSLSKFEETLKAINNDDYAKAADELLDSKLTKKRNKDVAAGVEKRANELADMLRQESK